MKRSQPKVDVVCVAVVKSFGLVGEIVACDFHETRQGILCYQDCLAMYNVQQTSPYLYYILGIIYQLYYYKQFYTLVIVMVTGMGIQTRIHNVLIDKKILVVSNTILGL